MEENKVKFQAKPKTGWNAKSVVPAGVGKLPPQALELEEAVLGALMLEKDALTTVIDILRPQSFYKEAHQKIFSAIVGLFDKSEPIDILTVVTELRERGELEFVGGPYYVSQLTTRVNSAANIEFHARIISENSIKRELIGISSEVLSKAYEDTTDVFDLLDRTEAQLFEVSESNIRKNFDDMRSLMVKAIKELEVKKNQKEGLTGVPSGFTALDRITSGWQPSDLIILAARPGMGKTAFVVSAMRNAAVEFKKPVAIFSLEMSSLQLMTGSTDGKGPGNREQEIASISRALKMIAKELSVPVIALSQLSRAVETRGGDKKPQLSDLRESGSIEQDADIVMFLYRPEYYKITVDEMGNPTAGTGEVIIAKHRNGSLENVILKFIGKFTKFADLDNDFNSEFNPTSFSASSTFESESPGTIRLGSKMNDGGGFPGSAFDEEPPF